MRVTIRNLGQFGVNLDRPAWTLPANAWTEGIQVSFGEGCAKKGLVYDRLYSVNVKPEFVMMLGTTGILAADSNFSSPRAPKLYSMSLSAITDKSRVAPYTWTAADRFTGSMFNGIPVLNNGVDTPQYWPDRTAAFADLIAWPANTYAKVLRPFKNFLVALNITKTTTNYSRMVKWSHSAAPGAVPSSWDETDATKDAGEVVLSEGDEALVDCLPMGEVNLLYTKGQTWQQRLSGDSSIFTFTKLFDEVGLLAADCVKMFKRQHFVVTDEDVIVHNGVEATSIATDVVKSWLFATMDSSNAERYAYVVPFYNQQEMWVVFPYALGSPMALIWNWRLNAWYQQPLPDGGSCVSSTRFSARTGYSREEIIVMTGGITASNPIGAFREGLKTGLSYQSYLSRTFLPLAGMLDSGEPALSYQGIKYYEAIYPRFTAAAGKKFNIFAGVADEVTDSISWSASKYNYTVGTDKKLDVNKSGRFLHFRVQDATTGDWSLDSYDVEMRPEGEL